MLLPTAFIVSTLIPLAFGSAYLGHADSERTTSYTAALTRKAGHRSPSSQHLRQRGLSEGQGCLTDVDQGQVFVTPVSFGDQERYAVVDTGSSDTWMVTENFKCFNASTTQSIPESGCMFGNPVGAIAGFSKIANEHLNITYSDGENLYGATGLTQVTVAGIRVPDQQVSLVSLATWDGDGTSSGVLGLSYPATTSVFYGTNGSADNFSTNSVHYSPIFSTMVSDNLIAPILSIAISRDASNQGNGGLIEFGGIPLLSEPDINATDGFAHVPIQQVFSPPQHKYEFLFYSLDVECITSSDGDLTNSSGLYIVDSGTTLIFVPTAAAQYLNSLFNPPAIYDNSSATYIVDCNADSFQVSFEVGGKTFGINPRDLIANRYGQSDTECVSGIQDGGDGSEGPFVLGDVFMKNVLVVIDTQTETISLGSRMYYDS